MQRARAAGPTLAGTLETCVLGGGQPLAQSRRGVQGGQEPDHLLPLPHPPVTRGLWSWEIHAPSPALEFQEPACLPKQGSLRVGAWPHTNPFAGLREEGSRLGGAMP